MPSFDVVSEVDAAEVDNACANVMREIGTRYDFKGSNCDVTNDGTTIRISADDDLKLRQMHEILQGHLQRRGIEPGQVDYGKVEPAAGQSVRQTATVIEGISTDLAKRIVKDIKGTKMKVQAAIQGDTVRITGKKRDDLQEVIAFIKGLDIEQPLQFKNFRD
jgi:uncharacterized protein YajQ (UPF0234 family)